MLVRVFAVAATGPVGGARAGLVGESCPSGLAARAAGFGWLGRAPSRSSHTGSGERTTAGVAGLLGGLPCCVDVGAFVGVASHV